MMYKIIEKAGFDKEDEQFIHEANDISDTLFLAIEFSKIK